MLCNLLAFYFNSFSSVLWKILPLLLLCTGSLAELWPFLPEELKLSFIQAENSFFDVSSHLSVSFSKRDVPLVKMVALHHICSLSKRDVSLVKLVASVEKHMVCMSGDKAIAIKFTLPPDSVHCFSLLLLVSLHSAANWQEQLQ